jgi:hypothetical protein
VLGDTQALAGYRIGMATEQETRNVMFALMEDAFVHARIVGRFPEQAESVPSVTEVANLFHNVPTQLRDLDDQSRGSLTAIEILERTRFYAQRRDRLSTWLEAKLSFHGYDG